jgi:hypothetical protein
MKRLKQIWAARRTTMHFYDVDSAWNKLSNEIDNTVGHIVDVSEEEKPLYLQKMSRMKQSGRYWLIHIVAMFIIAGLTFLFCRVIYGSQYVYG